MKSITFFTLLFLYAIQGSALAQWKTETYQLKGGWNAIYVHGDASYTTLDDLLSDGTATNISEVWRWNQGSSSVLYTESPSVQSPGTPEWSIWKRGDAANNTLTKLTANSGYLVRCTGTSSDTHSVALILSPRPPKAQWVREGANLLSFQTKRTSPGSIYDFFSEGFPAAITGSDIYKYIGGDLSAANPFKIFSPSFEPLNRNQAYWFESQVVDNYHGPIEVELSNPQGLHFATRGSVINLKLKNRTSQVQTVNLAGSVSGPAPAGITFGGGGIVLGIREYDVAQMSYVTTHLSNSTQRVIQPNETAELNIVIHPLNAGINNAQPGTLYASLLTITDAAGMMEVELPVSFTKGSLSGLWLGEAEVTQIPYTPKAQAEVSSGVLTAINFVGRPAGGYTTPPVVTVTPPSVQGTQATVTAVLTDGAISSFSITNAGSGYEKPPGVRIAAPPVGNSTPLTKPMPLRVVLHRDDSGTFRLLSHVYLGQLASDGELGVCTSESLLDPALLSGASRFSVAHLPLNLVNVGTGDETGTLTHVVDIPHNDPTNPFVHQYHPDHDNLDARFESPLSAGDESPAIKRTLQFEFTTDDPTGGSTPLGWGSTILGGNFTETLEGIHSEPITLQGYFKLQRVSAIPTLSQ